MLTFFVWHVSLDSNQLIHMDTTTGLLLLLVAEGIPEGSIGMCFFQRVKSTLLAGTGESIHGCLLYPDEPFMGMHWALKTSCGQAYIRPRKPWTDHIAITSSTSWTRVCVLWLRGSKEENFS